MILLIRRLRLSTVALDHRAVTLRLRVATVLIDLHVRRRVRSVSVVLALHVRLARYVGCREGRLTSGRVYTVRAAAVRLSQARVVRRPIHLLWETVTIKK